MQVGAGSGSGMFFQEGQIALPAAHPVQFLLELEMQVGCHGHNQEDRLGRSRLLSQQESWCVSKWVWGLGRGQVTGGNHHIPWQ
jgi:hypothetical protein